MSPLRYDVTRALNLATYNNRELRNRFEQSHHHQLPLATGHWVASFYESNDGCGALQQAPESKFE